MVSIRERREALGLSRTELAEAVGISAKSLSRYESGEREPRASDLVKIASNLGCSVEDLVENPTLPRERPGDRMTANAALIAAAPEMLTATEAKAIYEAAVAAVKKARGL